MRILLPLIRFETGGVGNYVKDFEINEPMFNLFNKVVDMIYFSELKLLCKEVSKS